MSDRPAPGQAARHSCRIPLPSAGCREQATATRSPHRPIVRRSCRHRPVEGVGPLQVANLVFQVVDVGEGGIEFGEDVGEV